MDPLQRTTDLPTSVEGGKGVEDAITTIVDSQ